MAIVDDHRMVRDGIRMLVESRPGMTVVGEAANVADALALIEKESPDILLLDLDLKSETGLELLPQVKAVSEGTRVLILTGLRDPEAHQQCVRLGAKGLVPKESASSTLIKAIEKVHAGEIWFDRNMMSSLLSDVLSEKNGKRDDPEAVKIASLTEREREVTGLVCLGLKNKQIADRLFISDTTVRHHLTSIFSKLEVSDRLELVIYSYRYGLADPPK
ncbi:MAG: response regulator transcription factor [Rubrivivax sp.]|nr:response regulator transcription factor [Pyrinomonadaceae bacterium]